MNDEISEGYLRVDVLGQVELEMIHNSTESYVVSTVPSECSAWNVCIS